jgi:hypothetical protein
VLRAFSECALIPSNPEVYVSRERGRTPAVKKKEVKRLTFTAPQVIDCVAAVGDCSRPR